MTITGTTGTAVDPIAVWALALVTIGGGITLIWRVARGIRRILRRFDEVLDDWNGRPERPGHMALPGVMARLDRIEHELRPNSGTSLRDAVHRIERELGTARD